MAELTELPYKNTTQTKYKKLVKKNKELRRNLQTALSLVAYKRTGHSRKDDSSLKYNKQKKESSNKFKYRMETLDENLVQIRSKPVTNTSQSQRKIQQSLINCMCKDIWVHYSHLELL